MNCLVLEHFHVICTLQNTSISFVGKLKVLTELVQRDGKDPKMIDGFLFVVNGKSHPPLSSDEVWRLENIHKKGAYHKRLTTAKINTVRDFVTLLAINPKRLQKVNVDNFLTCVLSQLFSSGMFYVLVYPQV